MTLALYHSRFYRIQILLKVLPTYHIANLIVSAILYTTCSIITFLDYSVNKKGRTVACTNFYWSHYSLFIYN